MTFIFLMSTVTGPASGQDIPLIIFTPGEILDIGSLSSSLSESMDVENFAVPAYLGRIVERYDSGSDRIIIHIQDAHCDYAAQKKISEIAYYLNRKYGVKLFNLEGGVEGYDISVFTDIRNRDLRRELADSFVRDGLINGTEYYAVMNPYEAELWGIEDRDLYMRNLNAYRQTASRRDSVDIYLNNLSDTFEEMKKAVYCSKMKELDNMRISYENRKLDFEEYISSLIEMSSALSLDLENFPNISFLSETLLLGESVDFQKANRERTALLNDIKEILSPVELEKLASVTIAFSAERVTSWEYYNYILGKASEIGFDPQGFTALSRYFEYLSSYENIDKMDLMNEKEALKISIMSVLRTCAIQEKLQFVDRCFRIMKNMFDALITKDEYEFYKNNRKMFNISAIAGFIEKNAPSYGLRTGILPGMEALDAYREEMDKFYTYAFARDRAFIENMRFSERITPGDSTSLKVAAMVTGGFHSAALHKELENNNTSYVSIIPNFRIEDDQENPYFALLAGGAASLADRIVSIVSPEYALQIASIFNELGIDFWDRDIQSDLPEEILRRIDDMVQRGEFTEQDVRECRETIHQKIIDARLEKAEFSDIDGIDDIIEEVKHFFEYNDADEDLLEIVDGLKGGTNSYGESLIRSVAGMPEWFRGHAGGRGIRIRKMGSLQNEKDRKEIKAILIHEIIAAVYGDHTLASRAEEVFLRGLEEKIDLKGANPFQKEGKMVPIWDLTPEERSKVSRDYMAVADADTVTATAAQGVSTAKEEYGRRWQSRLEDHTFEDFVVIPDIHGDMERLEDMLEEIAKFPRVKKIYFTGDIIDRGPKSLAVIEYLKDLKKTWEIEGREIEVYFTYGNHDMMFMQAVRGDRRLFSAWMINGGAQVLAEILGRDEFIKKIGVEPETINVRNPNYNLYLGDLAKLFYDPGGEIFQKAQEIYKWMHENFKLFHIEDQTGTLMIHAGIPVDKAEGSTLQYRGFWHMHALRKAQGDLDKYLDPDTSESERGDIMRSGLFDFLNRKELGSPLWVRGWETAAEGQVDRVLDQMGVTGIVAGHTIMADTVNVDDKIFLQDLGLVRGVGGALAYTLEDGLQKLRLEWTGSQSQPSVQRTEIVGRDALIDQVEGDIDRKWNIDHATNRFVHAMVAALEGDIDSAVEILKEPEENYKRIDPAIAKLYVLWKENNYQEFAAKKYELMNELTPASAEYDSVKNMTVDLSDLKDLYRGDAGILLPHDIRFICAIVEGESDMSKAFDILMGRSDVELTPNKAFRYLALRHDIDSFRENRDRLRVEMKSMAGENKTALALIRFYFRNVMYHLVRQGKPKAIESLANLPAEEPAISYRVPATLPAESPASVSDHTPDMTGNISSGLDNEVTDSRGMTEEERWKKQSRIDDNRARNMYPRQIRDIEKTQNVFLNEEGEIRDEIKKLLGKNFPEKAKEIEGIIKARLNILYGRRTPDKEGSGIGWMETRAELFRGKEKYLLGTESALALDLIQFLGLYSERQDLAPHEKAYLIEEYVLHEVLEATGLEHREIIAFTNALFAELYDPENKHAQKRENPLGDAIRFFLNTKLSTSAAAGVLSNVRRQDHPSVTIIGVKGDQLLWDGTTLNSHRSHISRSLQRQGVNSYIAYYDIDNPEYSLEDVILEIGRIPGINDDGARILAFANTAKRDETENMIAQNMDKMDMPRKNFVGAVPGDFADAERDERMSIVLLHVLGIGLMEWHRADGQRQIEISDSLKHLFSRMIANPEDFNDYLLDVKDMNDFIRNHLLKGLFDIKIRRINFQEIRDFIEAETAVLRSL